ncbi:virulence RhuM family protein [Clostridium tertium]|uniref:virulence RhuM family protein n=1 Tax=Clostridium tertium TaxID=1559 RepID=UPI0011417E4D|nr:virulence RhuM family protein [Clostridium tertium]
MIDRNNVIMYESDDGKFKIDVRVEDETVWLTQRGISELYQKGVNTINEHIKNIFNERELNEEATIRKNRIVQTEGNRQVEREVTFYNLDMILAVGYRVRSQRGTQFRQWATERLSEYLIKGFTMDDEKLKEMRNFGEDYFDELLERIRDIRASEKRFYKKITDIYALSVDYSPTAPITKEFFSTVQNKLHYAIHGNTAAELIAQRANAEKPHMGLTTWKGKDVKKIDISSAKNYLTEKELKSLNRIVSMYLDYAEDQAERGNVMYMKDWKEKLDLFLQFNGREVLNNSGKISHEIAIKLATEQYEKYKNNKKLDKEKDDFDKFLEESNIIKR